MTATMTLEVPRVNKKTQTQLDSLRDRVGYYCLPAPRTFSAYDLTRLAQACHPLDPERGEEVFPAQALKGVGVKGVRASCPVHTRVMGAMKVQDGATLLAYTDGEVTFGHLVRMVQANHQGHGEPNIDPPLVDEITFRIPIGLSRPQLVIGPPLVCAQLRLWRTHAHGT